MNDSNEAIDKPDSLEAALKDARALVTRLEKLSGARAPSVAPRPAPAPEAQKAPPMTLEDRVRNALLRESLDTSQLGKGLGEPLDKLSLVLRNLRAEGKIVNVGSEEVPTWCWRIGNETDTKTLRQIVHRLITERPMKLRELVHATGARDSRVSGVMAELQRYEQVVDLGGGGHAKTYFIISDRAKDATLKSRPTTRAERNTVGKK